MSSQRTSTFRIASGLEALLEQTQQVVAGGE